MLRILLDTDFLLNSLRFRIDIISGLAKVFEHDFSVSVLDKTLDEITRHDQSRLALEIIKNKSISVIGTEGNSKVDDLLMEYGLKGFVIATLDRKLKNTLKEKNIKTITIRQKKYFAFS